MVDSKVPNSTRLAKTPNTLIQRLKEEDDHWISEEELYTEGSSDEEGKTPRPYNRKYTPRIDNNLHGNESLIPESGKESPDDSEVKGMSLTRQDIAESDKTLSEMKQKIRALREAVYDPKKMNDIFDAGHVRDKLVRKQKALGPNRYDGNMDESLAEIKRMDDVLKLKAEEEREARLSRMYCEEKNSTMLAELLANESSDALRHNSEQFLKLVYGSDSLNSSAAETPESSNSDSFEEPFQVRKEKNKSEKDAKNDMKTFIEKNKQLARCGRGVLSLTDEEKQRLEELLKDMKSSTPPKSGSILSRDKSEDTDSVGSSSLGDNYYLIDENSQQLLRQIDEKLKVYKERREFLSSRLNTKTKNEEKTSEETEKADCKEEKPDQDQNKEKETIEEKGEKEDKEKEVEVKERKGKPKKKDTVRRFSLKDNSYRLKEVDKMIGNVTATCKEDVSPLTEEDLRALIEDAQNWMNTTLDDSDQKDSEISSEEQSVVSTSPSSLSLSIPSTEKIIELVFEAKSEMPNFKYRHVNT